MHRVGRFWVLWASWALPTLSFAQSDTLFVAAREDHSPHLTLGPSGAPVITWVATAPDTNAVGRFDEIAVSARGAGGWGTPQIVAGPGNLYSPNVAYASDGARWIAWCEHDGTDSQIFCRRDQGPTSLVFELGDPGQPDIEPVMCRGNDGSVIVAWQGWRSDDYDIFATQVDAAGPGPTLLVSECDLNDREPTVVWGNGRAWIVWSSYRGQPYNLMLKTFDGSTLSPLVQLTNSYRARNLHPEVAWDDRNGLLWITALWVNQGWSGYNQHEIPGLYDQGSPRVRAFDGTTLYQPLGLNSDNQYPMLTMEQLGYTRFEGAPDRCGAGVDVVTLPDGRVRFFHRQIGTLTEFGAPNRYWGMLGVEYAGNAWSSPTQFFDPRSSVGWETPASVCGADTLWVSWSADRRSNPIAAHLNVFGHDLNLVIRGIPVSPGAPVAPQLQSLGAPVTPAACSPLPPRTQFTLNDHGRTRVLLWGDNHRHSQDLSWDAGADPNIQETLFYSLDWIGHDFITPSDHAERFSKAIWAWVPKWAELYDVPGRFRIFPGYERSMRGGAKGDQNATYRDPAQFTEASAAYPSIASWFDMYDAMEGIDVLTVPHTTAQCDADTDWFHLAGADPRSLPAPLRVAEVYQSARESFEYPNCPKQYTGCVISPSNGWINVALGLGMRIGLIAASDHTIRTGFIGVWAEDNSRDKIWEAIHDRHTFGTSRGVSKMNVDFRVGGEIMGSEVVSASAPTIFVHILATGPIDSIEINKDGDPSWFLALPGATSDTTFSFVDPDPVVPGTSSYYYLRFLDSNNKMAWTSPVWVDFIDPVAAPNVTPSAAGTLELVVSPNPAAADVRFDARGLDPTQGASVRVYDIGGRLVRRFDVRAGDAGQAISWDRRDATGLVVAPGSYFAVLSAQGQMKSARFVLVK